MPSYNRALHALRTWMDSWAGNREGGRVGMEHSPTSATTAFLSGSLPLATAVALGGFFIDVDHAVDYVLFNRQWDLRPAVFLRYYLEARPERVVLVLHSWELFALLAAIAWWTGCPLLWGYLGGSSMHLLLDIAFNGSLATAVLLSQRLIGAKRWVK